MTRCEPGSIVIYRDVRGGFHDCVGQEVILELLSRFAAQVVYSDLCPLSPAEGCDGLPFFRPGDLVLLPEGRKPPRDEPFTIEDLILCEPPTTGFEEEILMSKHATELYETVEP